MPEAGPANLAAGRKKTVGVLSAIHGRPPTLAGGRPCCFVRERAERYSKARLSIPGC